MSKSPDSSTGVDAPNWWIGLHGSGRDERDLPPLVRAIAPGTETVALRGALQWEQGYAFVRRHPDRRIDEADLAERCGTLAAHIESLVAVRSHLGPPGLVGISNGAIVAAALLLKGAVAAACSILLRPMPPWRTPPQPRALTTAVLLLDARDDPRRDPNDARRLARQLQATGAAFCHLTVDGGHAPGAADLELARNWLGTPRH